MPSPSSSMGGAARSWLILEVHHAVDDEVPAGQKCQAQDHGLREQRVVSSRVEVGGMHESDDQDQYEGGRRQKYPGKAPFRGKGPDLQTKLDPTAQELSEPIQNLGEISSRLALDVDRDREEREIGLSHPLCQMIEGYFLLQPERDLVRQYGKLGSDRIGHFTRDESERDAKRVAGAKAAHDDVERVGQLLGEAGNPPAPRPQQIEVQGCSASDDGDCQLDQAEAEPKAEQHTEEEGQSGENGEANGRCDGHAAMNNEFFQPIYH